MKVAELPIGDDDNAVRARHHRFPWCDTCKRPAVFNESFGMLHSTVARQFGLPPHLDDSGHDVTIREWNLSVSTDSE